MKYVLEAIEVCTIIKYKNVCSDDIDYYKYILFRY